MSSTSELHVSPRSGRSGGVAVVVSGWPRLSETFALNELLALRKAGMLAAVFATKAGDLALIQPHSDELDVQILADGDAERQGAEVAQRLFDTDVMAVHGYFAHHPAAVAQVAARHLRVPFGFSVHAVDARKVTARVLASRARSASTVVACNPDVAVALNDVGCPPTLLPHGVDLDRFCVADPPDGPVLQLLAVGRLVEKKGFEVLVQTMAQLTGVHLKVVGDGPLRAALQAQAEALALGDRVQFVGRKTHDELPAQYAAADMVIVPSVVDRTGDRDGLPNVVLEGMACARPIVGSDVAAISTAVVDGITGVLVPPGDVAALSEAIRLLTRNRSLRHALGAAGRRRRRESVRPRSVWSQVLQRAGACICLTDPSPTS